MSTGPKVRAIQLQSIVLGVFGSALLKDEQRYNFSVLFYSNRTLSVRMPLLCVHTLTADGKCRSSKIDPLCNSEKQNHHAFLYVQWLVLVFRMHIPCITVSATASASYRYELAFFLDGTINNNFYF